MTSDGRSPFARRYEEALLRRYPPWTAPARLLLPPRRSRPQRSRWAWLPALAVAAAIALLLNPNAPTRPGAATALGPQVTLLSWPAGFGRQSRLVLTHGWLVMYQGAAVSVRRAGQLSHPLWTLHLPSSSRIEAAGAQADGITALVVRRGRRTTAILVGTAGHVLGRTTLDAVGASTAPFWIRGGPSGRFLISDRDSTWIVGPRGRVWGRLPGGSGALWLSDNLGPGELVSWLPTRSTLFVWSPRGSRIWTVREPGGPLAGSHLAPIDAGPGFVWITPRGVAVPYVIGLDLPGNRQVQGPSRWLPAGPVDPEAELVSRPSAIAVHAWSAPAGFSFHALPNGRALGLVSWGAVVLARRANTVVAMNLGGEILSRTTVQPRAMAFGGLYAYGATRRGLVQWGPYAPPAVPAGLVWTARTPVWSARLRLSPTRMQPPALNYSVPLNTPLLSQGGALGIASSLNLDYTGVNPSGIETLGLTAPPGDWWLPIQDGLLTSASHLLMRPPAAPGYRFQAVLPGSHLWWTAVAEGWVRVPNAFTIPVEWGTGVGPLTHASLTFTRAP